MAGLSNDPSEFLGGVIGAPVTLTSGRRSQQQNALVGGVPNSAHLSGQAYDFVPKGISTAEAASRFAKTGIPFDQIIDEGSHVHVSFAPTNRRQVIQSKMADVSDADLLGAMGAAPKAAPQANVSDADLLSAMGSKNASGTSPSGNVVNPQAKAGTPTYQNMPFGFSQEVQSHIPFAKDIAAGVPAGLDALTGRGSFGANYRQNLSDYNAAQQAYEAENPGLSTLGAGLGIMASGGPAKGLAQGGIQTLRQLMASGAKGGATLGALFGLGDAGDGSGGLDARAGNAARGAGLGLVTGGAIPVLGASVTKAGQAVGGLVNRLVPDAVTTAGNRAKSIIEGFAGGPVAPKAAELVPGSKANLAESTGNTGIAALTRALRDLNPNSPLVAREAENAAARGTHLEGAIGTPEDVQAALAARDEAAAAQLKGVFPQAAAPITTPERIISKDEMIKRGADGSLSRAYERYIPVEKVSGLEPTPSAAEGMPYKKGTSITQPIEVAYDKANDTYTLYSGNHRITQAQLNGDKYIPAFIEPDGKSIGKAAVSQIPAKKADTKPVSDVINEILSGSSGSRPAVKQAMGDVQKILDNDGKPITDPKTLYDSVRKGIDDLISGKDLTKGYGAQAARELISVKDQLDEVIEKSAQGFKQYLEDYAQSSAPISSMKFLQSLNLTDAKGNITLSKVQNAIKRLEAQQAGPGLGKGAKAVTTAQQQALESIRDDLLRADVINQGKSIGSNTIQNALAQKRLGFAERILPEGIGATAGAGLGGLIAGHAGAELGGLAGDRIGAAIGGMRAARSAQSQALLQSTLEDMLLNPSRYTNPAQGIPSKVRPLNEILNDPKMRALMAGGNRLVIANQPRAKEGSR